ncbi:MAG: hypothetical protein ABIW76_14695 [Fibrobacteria bacterium]
MAFRKVALLSFLAILSACENTRLTQPEAKNGVLQSAQVRGAMDSIAVGDSIELSAGFTSSGPIDSSLLRFTWRLAGFDSTFKNLSESDIAKLIPKEPGKYSLYLDITYSGKTVSALIIFVVAEKIVYVDSSRNAQLKVLIEKLPGYYVGSATTPWLPPYGIAMVFRADGSYSAFTTDTTDSPALYYGMDEDAPGKTWSLEDVTAAGNAVGKINVVFDVGTEVEDEIKSLRFNPDYAELQFSIYHFGNGPIKVALYRIQADALPPRK